MFRRFRFLSMLLVVVVVAGMLVAFAPGEEPEAKATLGPVQAVTLSTAGFVPRTDEVGFLNDGDYLFSDGPMLAQISFPAETVVITSVKARVFDDAVGDLCVSLHRGHPAMAAADLWGQECTSGQSDDNPQTVSITVFRRVGKHHTAYLMVSFSDRDSNLSLYGATVFYRVVT